jgi:hypothetical protein
MKLINNSYIIFFFTGATNLYEYLFRGGAVDPQPGGPGTALRLSWLTFPGIYAPASIALLLIVEHGWPYQEFTLRQHGRLAE